MPIFLYCGCKKYRERFLLLHYILSMWYCLILLERYFPWKVRVRVRVRVRVMEVIENLGIYSENQKFVSSSTIYEDNNWAIAVEISTRMTPTSNHIAVKYHWFRQHIGQDFVIWNINSENQKADIFIKGLQVQIFVRVIKLLCGW